VITKYSYGDKNKEGEIGRVCGRHGGKINAYRVLVGKYEGKRTLRGPNKRQKDSKNVTGRNRKACSGLIWLKRGTGYRLFRCRSSTFRYLE